MLVNVPRLVTYYTKTSEPSVPGQRVAFRTSGHGSSAFEESFNERHILAICPNRERKKIDGPLFLGVIRMRSPRSLAGSSTKCRFVSSGSLMDYSTARLVLPERKALARLSFVCRQCLDDGQRRHRPCFASGGDCGARRGLRISTRSTLRASSERIIRAASWRRHRRWLTMLLQ
jgi:hypothetical protein